MKDKKNTEENQENKRNSFKTNLNGPEHQRVRRRCFAFSATSKHIVNETRIAFFCIKKKGKTETNKT